MQETDVTYLTNMAPWKCKKGVRKKLKELNDTKERMESKGTIILTLFDNGKEKEEEEESVAEAFFQI